MSLSVFSMTSTLLSPLYNILPETMPNHRFPVSAKVWKLSLAQACESSRALNVRGKEKNERVIGGYRYQAALVRITFKVIVI